MPPSPDRVVRYPSWDQCGQTHLGNGHGASDATDVL